MCCFAYLKNVPLYASYLYTCTFLNNIPQYHNLSNRQVTEEHVRTYVRTYVTCWNAGFNSLNVSGVTVTEQVAFLYITHSCAKPLKTGPVTFQLLNEYCRCVVLGCRTPAHHYVNESNQLAKPIILHHPDAKIVIWFTNLSHGVLPEYTRTPYVCCMQKNVLIVVCFDWQIGWSSVLMRSACLNMARSWPLTFSAANSSWELLLRDMRRILCTSWWVRWYLSQALS